MFLGQVLHLLLFQVLVLLGAVGLEDAEGCVEALLNGVFVVLVTLGFAAALDELFQFVVHVFLVQLIEMETDGCNFVLDVLDIGVLHRFFKQFHELQFVESFQIGIIFHQFLFVGLREVGHFGHHLVDRRSGRGEELSHECVYFDSHLAGQDAGLDQFDNLLFLVTVDGFLAGLRRRCVLNTFLNGRVLSHLFVVFHFN